MTARTPGQPCGTGETSSGWDLRLLSVTKKAKKNIVLSEEEDDALETSSAAPSDGVIDVDEIGVDFEAGGGGADAGGSRVKGSGGGGGSVKGSGGGSGGDDNGEPPADSDDEGSKERSDGGTDYSLWSEYRLLDTERKLDTQKAGIYSCYLPPRAAVEDGDRIQYFACLKSSCQEVPRPRQHRQGQRRPCGGPVQGAGAGRHEEAGGDWQARQIFQGGIEHACIRPSRHALDSTASLGWQPVTDPSTPLPTQPGSS